KRQGLAGVATEPLAQGVVPALLVSGEAGGLAGGDVLVRREKHGISAPTVGVARASAVSKRDSLPHHAAGVLGVIANGISDNLTSAPTLGCPQPALEELLAHKAHHLVHFQHISCLG